MPRRYQITVDGTIFDVDFISRSADTIEFSVAGQSHRVQIAAPISPAHVPLSGAAGTAHSFTPQPSAPILQSGSIVAPMPGIVAKVMITVGETVSVGQTLLLIEAMKMENAITSNKGGVIKSLEVSAGSEVKKNQLLVVVE